MYRSISVSVCDIKGMFIENEFIYVIYYLDLFINCYLNIW